MLQQVAILGSTGSIGNSTLDVIRLFPERYQVAGLSGHRNIQLLAQQCIEFSPQVVAVPDETSREALMDRLSSNLSIDILVGQEGLIQLASDPHVDTVMAAIVGSAGMMPTLSAIKAGKKVLLANKESLVTAGALMMAQVKESGSLLLPVDSEHNAIFQCLPPNYDFSNPVQGLDSILLTASGGPFRSLSLDALKAVTPDQACKHPNWDMGRKISVDSATLMNKGLELIEACWLFDVVPDQIEVLIHPQSIIHSMVRYRDGSVIAQMGTPDMKTPIAYSLSWPERHKSGASPLNFTELGGLTFDKPDEDRFACLRLAKQAFKEGGVCGAVLNAANEIAVEAFLKGDIGFLEIAQTNEFVLGSVKNEPLESIEQVLVADQNARTLAKRRIYQ